MASSIAVLFIHGVEVRDPRYADAAMRRLRREFAKHTAGRDGAEHGLVIEPAYWIPSVERHEDRLLEHTFGARTKDYYRVLNKLVARVDGGSVLALAPLTASGVIRTVPGISKMDFPTLRWLMTYFVGDAIAYQVTRSDRRVYDAIHDRVDMALHRLAKRAGPDAPLCIVSHSLGTVIASDHVWDRQHQVPGQPSPHGDTPVERCETLAFMYTLGSPIALWTMRYENFGEPITFPNPALARRYPELRPEWTNYYDRDDIVAYPLRGLSPAYASVVSQDRQVAVGPPIVRNTPLAHLWYWNDSSVMGPVGEALARAWLRLPLTRIPKARTPGKGRRAPTGTTRADGDRGKGNRQRGAVSR